MKIKTKLILIPAILLLILGMISISYALTEKKVTNIFETGGVNIGLKQYSKQNGEESVFSDATDIAPGQKISMIPRVTNYAEPCYIRVQVGIKMDNEVNRPILLDDCYGISDDWVRMGDYLYYKIPIDYEKSVDVCQGIAIPKEWTNKSASSFQITILAEAIQAKNFDPDFSKENPWGSVDIEVSKVEDSYEINSVKKGETKGINIVYADGSSNFAIDSDNFFKSFGKLMPGDNYSETIEFKNKSQKEIEVFFKTSFNDSDLLNKMHLTIENELGVFYDGALSSSSLKDYKVLLKLDKGKTGKARFSVSMPKELANGYQEIKDEVTWWFMVKDIDGKAVQTSDSPLLWCFAIVCILLGSVLIVFYRKKWGEQIDG